MLSLLQALVCLGIVGGTLRLSCILAGGMLWDQLRAIFRHEGVDRYSLPVLQKPSAGKQDQQQEQQLGRQPVEKEYCSRMVFKLTPKYSSQLQVSSIRRHALHKQ